MTSLPLELITEILGYCDGDTLLKIALDDPWFKSVITQYLRSHLQEAVISSEHRGQALIDTTIKLGLNLDTIYHKRYPIWISDVQQLFLNRRPYAAIHALASIDDPSLQAEVISCSYPCGLLKAYLRFYCSPASIIGHYRQGHDQRRYLKRSNEAIYNIQQNFENHQASHLSFVRIILIRIGKKELIRNLLANEVRLVTPPPIYRLMKDTCGTARGMIKEKIIAHLTQFEYPESQYLAQYEMIVKMGYKIKR